MAYVRANSENHECIIENYHVLKLEKYVLESNGLEARQKEHDFHNTFRALTDEVELKRKHYDEASSHYNLCVVQEKSRLLKIVTQIEAKVAKN